MDPDVRFIKEGSGITFRGNSNDEDLIWGDSLTYGWNSSIDGSLGEGENITPALSVGEHLITLTVTDSGGVSNTTSFGFTVEEKEGARGEVMRTTVLIGIVIVIGFLVGTLIGMGIAVSRRNKREEEDASEGKTATNGEKKEGENVEKTGDGDKVEKEDAVSSDKKPRGPGQISPK